MGKVLHAANLTHVVRLRHDEVEVPGYYFVTELLEILRQEIGHAHFQAVSRNSV